MRAERETSTLLRKQGESEAFHAHGSQRTVSKYDFMGIKKIRNFMEISKSWSYVSDKVHLKQVIYKKTAFFLKKMAESKNLLFLVNNTF